MKIRSFSFSKLKKYNHPAVLLFRGIELKILSQVLPKYKLKKPSVDIGSGDGFISSLIFKNPFSYGVDNNEAGDVQSSIKKKRYGKVLIESAEKMSLKSNSVNFVFSNSVIEHIPQNELLLLEVSRILKPNGYFAFTCPSSYFTEFITSQFGQKYAMIRNKHLNHYHLYNHITWKKRLSEAKFKIVDYCYYMTKSDLLFWDKLVWLYKLLFFVPPLRSKLMTLFENKVKKIVFESTSNKVEGANILVIAQKK